MISQRGRCLCGSIAYEASAPPARVTFCHCKFCQRATGSAFLVETFFDKSDFAVISGTPKRYDHQSEGSGKLIHVHFCDGCGTKLFFSFERHPAMIGVFAGTFDDPNWFERSPANTKHIFVAYGQSGTVIPAGFNVFEEYVVTHDGDPIMPTVFDHHVVIDQN